MKLEYRIGMYVLGVLVVILVSIYTAHILYFTRVPAVAPFGFALMVFFIFLDSFLVVAEGKSPQVISNVGHWSVNATKDMMDVPWQVEITDERAKDLNLLSISIILAGGIDYYGISIHSGSEKPVILCPSIFIHKEEKNYCCYANLERYELDELPIYLQYILKRHFTSRVKDKTPIYYSEVSHMDGSATPDILKKLHEQRDWNKENSAYIDRMVRLYDELERGEKHKRKIFVKKELEEVNDENS